PIGGFNGTDPSPTLAQFQQYVAEGRIHWFVAGGGGPGGGPGGPGGPGGGPGGPGLRGGPGTSATSTSARITSWVEATFRSTTVGGVTLYDLTAPITTTATS